MLDAFIFGSEKVFNAYLAGSIFVRPFQLYDIFGDMLFSQSLFEHASLYFIVENSRIRFAPTPLAISRNGDLETGFLVENDKHFRHTINIHRFILELVIENYDPTNFVSALVGVKSYEDYMSVVSNNANIPLTGVAIDRTQSDDQLLMLNLISRERTEELPLPAYRLFEFAGIRLPTTPLVTYVGQSKNLKKRSLNHEKIQRALAEIPGNKDVFIYFFDFNGNNLYMNEKIKELLDTIDNPDLEDVSHDGRINLVEMSLINYFKPRYNARHVNSELSQNKQVEELLKYNGFTKIVLEVNFDSQFWAFGSESIPSQNGHIVIFQLNEENV